MKAVTQYLKSEGYGCVDDSFYSHIDLWFNWYKGKVARFHTYRQYNGKKKITRERKSLGMAKTVPEDWANLCLNEKVEIVIDGKAEGTPVHKILQKNNFRVRGNQLVELAFALGTGAIVEYENEGQIAMDYIRAGMIYPLRWDNGDIIDCAFGSERIYNNTKHVYLNIHEKVNGRYVVKNRMFVRNGNNLTKTDLPEGVAEEHDTGSEIPRFQILKPNIANNIDPDSPMGISVYANGIDQLKGVDLVYDSYLNEFALGKKRIIIPTSLARFTMEEDGMMVPIFDDNDVEFYAVPLENKESKETITEINMNLRHEAHEAGMKTALNLLSMKCGMGNDRYSFEHGSIKTATEVISVKSELYQNLKKHELILYSVLTNMVLAIADMIGFKVKEVAINFDDSIIEDETAKRNADLQEVRDGILNKWEFRAEHYGEDEETAKKMVAGASESGSNAGGLFGDE